MSLLKKIFPFLFKEKNATSTKASEGNKPASGNDRSRQPRNKPQDDGERREPGPIVGYAIVARNKNHRGLRKGSKVYVRQIMDDGERLRIRATSPSGKKITLTINRHALMDFESEGVPEHLARHYSTDSIFTDEHEAKVKAEVLGKR